MKPNSIYCGDCQKVLGNMNEFPDESVDLIYVDPPFFSNRNYEVLWGDGYELRAFEDRWKGGIENYIDWMAGRINQCYRVLKKSGTMYLHCDAHANAHLRILMDKIFGARYFQNEVIWHYGLGGSSPKRWAAKHDTILFYSKTDQFYFKPLMKPATSIRMAGKMKKWDDVWDIPTINNLAKERLGYPTQKPEALLECIIAASSKPGDIVLDPMCGCGTAVAVAQRQDRRWVGVDVSPTACKLMVKRMAGLSVGISDDDIIGLPRTIAQIEAMKPFEFQNWVCQKLMARMSPRKSGDMGIDGYLPDMTPLQIKQSEGIGRNVVDNFETALRRAKKDRGVIVAFSFGKGAIEEVARAKHNDDIIITLRTVEDILECG